MLSSDGNSRFSTPLYGRDNGHRVYLVLFLFINLRIIMTNSRIVSIFFTVITTEPNAKDFQGNS